MRRAGEVAVAKPLIDVLITRDAFMSATRREGETITREKVSVVVAMCAVVGGLNGAKGILAELRCLDE
jgi:hypothetical protein